jgi:predicted acylesterase/phospholipase RssA
MLDRRLFALGAAAFAGACVQSRLPSVPAAVSTAGKDAFLGISNAKFLVGARDEDIRAEWIAGERRRMALGFGGQYHLLALSGGGEDGAFGAGLLYGWTERGDRPEFEVVTGVSTGALMAPFAFLGPRYDEGLKRVYTTIDRNDILSERPIVVGILGDALSDTAPLMALIERSLTDEMIREIGAEYRRGRFLLVGTTNLDLGRQVVWNIGAIAAANRPEADRAIRRILLASAAIPAIFPPVLFDVEIDGEKRQELHVDGGASAQLFLYPAGLTVNQVPADIARRRRTAWIIRNGRTRPAPMETPRSFRDIATRSIATMIGANGVGDIYRAYQQTQRDRVDFNLAYITSGFDRTTDVPFDRDYMNALFEFGRRRMREGRVWVKKPPGFAT